MNDLTENGKKRDVYFLIFKFFLFIQFIILIFEIVLPVKSAIGNFSHRFLINVLFFSIIFVVALFTKDFFYHKKRTKINTQKVRLLSLKKLSFLINLSTSLGFLGIAMLIVDRVILKGIDYSLGLRHARYQWENAVSPSVFSEIISMLGNILVPMAFISILLLFLYWEDLKTIRRLNNLVISSLNVLLFAAMNGSRSLIFIQVFLLLCISILRKYKNRSIIPAKRRGKRSDKKFYFFLLIAILYVISVFNSSAALGDYSSKYLFEIFSNDLGGQVKDGYYLFLNNILNENSIIYSLFSAIIYLIHSQWTTEAILLLPTKEGDIFFYSILHFLNQLGILNEAPIGYQYAGLFISLPGAIIYDFGFTGLIILSIIYGLLLGIVILLIKNPNNSGGLSFALILFVLSSIYVAPFIPAHGFIYFNFIVFDVILLHFISRIFFGKSTWLHLDSK
ncbi:hypothetical protein [Bacillus sp. FJAT-45350]|uniref:hypothetical protein n=1 Tax=Bacillus sp. FJAT-45350 TaxID=2011014 RepID=UPI000BB8F4CB|nr:hypothetical protein [Bacillus sp. FJAT-45350]